MCIRDSYRPLPLNDRTIVVPLPSPLRKIESTTFNVKMCARACIIDHCSLVGKITGAGSPANSDPELIFRSSGTGLAPGFGFKKSSLVYFGGRDDGERYPFAVLPPLEVTVGATCIFLVDEVWVYR